MLVDILPLEHIDNSKSYQDIYNAMLSLLQYEWKEVLVN